MKKSLTTLFIMTLVTLSGIAQQTRPEMTIYQTVEVTLPNGNTMKNDITFYVKNGKCKSESSQNGMKMSTYYFNSTGSLHTVIEMGGQTQKNELNDAINQANNEFDKVEIQYFEEQKTINDILCKKAIILLKKGEEVNERVVWFDPEQKLDFPFHFGVAGLNLVNGLPVQYENEQMGLKMVHEVTKLDFTTPIPDKFFQFPKN